MTVLMALEGVLKKGPTTPIREGRLLYQTLVDADVRVVLMTNDSERLAEHWLQQNGIRGHAAILTPTVDLGDGTPLRFRQVDVARAAGRVDLVVDSDPEVIVRCLNLSQPALLFAHNKTMAPAFRPDQGVRAWAEIEALMDRQLGVQADDFERQDLE